MVIHYEIKTLREDFQNYTVGGNPVEPEVLDKALRFAMRNTMLRFGHRVDTMTQHWKRENVPLFISEIDIDKQLGITRIENGSIDFTLTNTRIWGMVSAGVPPHDIPVPESGHRFYGWFDEGDNSDDLPPEGSMFAGRPAVRFERKRDNVYASDRRNTRRRGHFRATERAAEQRDPQRRSASYPPTYLPATRPGFYGSFKPQALGDAIIQVENRGPGGEFIPGFPNREVVDHPGYEGRNFTGILLGDVGNPPGGDLHLFYFNSLVGRLEQFTTGTFKQPSGAFSGNAQLPYSTREFIVRQGEEGSASRGQPRQRQSFAVSQFLNREESAFAE